MRVLSQILVATCVLVASCVPTPPRIEKSCRAEGGCSETARRARVLEAFAGLKVSEVLECTSEPSDSCYSDDPDVDACLVAIPAGAVEAYRESQKITSTQLTTWVPSAVARFSGSQRKQFVRVFSDRPPQSLRERLIYSDATRSSAVLVVTEERCFRPEEVT